jgi:F0F1-type ATP synthase epsilon subunit
MIGELTKGEIFVVETHQKKKISDINKGLIRVDDNQVVVLVNL